VKVQKLSGLKFLREFFDHSNKAAISNNRIVTVDPSEMESSLNRSYLVKMGFNDERIISYCAPFYDKTNICDQVLIQTIETHRPDIVLINLGGGTQERLGLHIKNNLDFKPLIICTGAAISFLTGSQAPISKRLDDFHLGWLVRAISAPKTYVPRYLSGFKLVKLILQNPIKSYETYQRN
jgi:UDP-N-acetyl-D-mannosaminuronic acid transferase (WecB/TagA/CpsF family)